MNDEKKHHGTVDEYSSEQQFHKSPLLCEKSGAILLILVDSRIFKILYGSHCQDFHRV